MQGGLGITYFQDTAKDMQMENCSSKSIRTCPYPHPEPKPPQEDGGNIGRVSHVQSRSGNAGDGKIDKKNPNRFSQMHLLNMITRRHSTSRSHALIANAQMQGQMYGTPGAASTDLCG